MNSRQQRVLGEAQRLTEQAKLQWELGRTCDTEPLCLQALEVMRQEFGSSDLRVARQLYNLAGLYYLQARYEDAKSMYAEAIAIYEARPKPDPTALAYCYAWLATTWFDAWCADPAVDAGVTEGDSFTVSEFCYRRALALMEEADRSETSEFATCLNRLGYLLYYLERYADAEPYLLRALDLKERLFGRDHLECAECCGRLAMLYAADPTALTDPEPLFRRSFALCDSHLPSNSPRVLESLYRLFRFLNHAGDTNVSEPLYGRLHSLLQSLSDDQIAQVDWIWSGCCDHLRETGREHEALPMEQKLDALMAIIPRLRRELGRQESASGPDHPCLVSTLCKLANELRYEQEYAEAEGLYLRALEIQTQTSGAYSLLVIPIANEIGLLYRLQERYSEAKELLEPLKEIPRGDLQQERADQARLLENLGWIYAAEGEPLRLEQHYQGALALLDGPDEDGPTLCEMLFRFSIFYTREGRLPEAEACILETLELAARSPDVGALDFADYKEYYAEILNKMGRTEKAQRLARDAQTMRTNAAEATARH